MKYSLMVDLFIETIKQCDNKDCLIEILNTIENYKENISNDKEENTIEETQIKFAFLELLIHSKANMALVLTILKKHPYLIKIYLPELQNQNFNKFVLNTVLDEIVTKAGLVKYESTFFWLLKQKLEQKIIFFLLRRLILDVNNFRFVLAALKILKDMPNELKVKIEIFSKSLNSRKFKKINFYLDRIIITYEPNNISK